jgi:uncharacterized membrane protein
MIRTTLFLTIALTQPLAAQELPAIFNVTGVAASDVLNIRAEATATSEIVGSFAPDAKGIEVVAIEGSWAIVNHAEGTGYVSSSFLAHDGQANWSGLGTPLYCSGTEPFWSFTIDPAGGKTTFDLFDGEAVTAPIKQVWPATERSDLVALTNGATMAVMRPQLCSDGMSDRSYGIAFNLIYTDDAGGSISGCCSLLAP